MPSLTPEDQDKLIGPIDTWKCPTCGEFVRRNYCRECDEFFFLCNCKERENEHKDHRTY